jgi:hypothetical protein
MILLEMNNVVICSILASECFISRYREDMLKGLPSQSINS